MRFTSYAGCDIHQFGQYIGLSDTKSWPISNLILVFVCTEYMHMCILSLGYMVTAYVKCMMLCETTCIVTLHVCNQVVLIVELTT